MRAVMPWPYPALWPNARPHWGEKARAVKAYRRDVAILARAAGWHRIATPTLIRVTFCAKPMGRAPDRDYCIAAFKAGQDGLADVFGVDDGRLTFEHDMGDRCRDCGVIVDLIHAVDICDALNKRPATVRARGA